MSELKALKAIAKEVSEQLRWFQEEGITSWKPPVQPAAQPQAQADAQADGPSTTPSHPPSAELTLTGIRSEMGECQRCKLAPTRTHIVFGVGNPHADLLFVGEGPGADEDRQGEPFVGRAGKLLTKMIAAMGLGREQIYIANIIKCRPPNNRNPQTDEITACRPFLDQQIAAIRPKIICALGTFSAQTLLRSKERISDLRGKFHDLNGVKVLPTFHPAYLLRNPSEKKHVWEDLQMIMAELNLPSPERK